MNHKHVKKCHYRSLQHDFWEQLSKHELHSGDWVQIAKRWHVLFSCFSFFIFFLLLTKKRKNMKNNEKCVYFSRKKDIIYALQGCSWRDVLRKTLRFFALWWHFGSQSLVWSVVRFHVNSSAHPCRLQPMVLWPVRPSVIEKSTQWWQEWILSLRPCLVRPLHCLSLPVLTLFWIDEVPCYTWPPTTWVPDAPFLSVVVRRLAPRGQRFRNEISFDRLLPEQIE